ncbi:MAG: TauD/TfdA family dioxygenase [Burkholderiaceae bacterium]|nr:TauD/TfdA family dioxygenase [Burkholderiaceae bacterium]MBP7658417.1 TauD/TfdA family dioxygenase [Burkholderiaceae bacterium]
MSQSSVRVTPYSSALGAVISGADLARPISDADFAVIRQAFLDHGVIFFRDQHLTPEQHLNFARRFAPIDINRFFKAVDGYPEIAEVRKEAEQTTNIGGGWHTDHSYDQVPAMGSVLLAREVPPSGGDTLFASMSKVYEALSPGLKSTLDRLCAVHSSRHVFGDKGGYAKTSDLGARIGNAAAAVQDAVHPVVIRHPETGRKTLYVNSAFTLRFEGWTAQESEPLLRYLYQFAARPEFSCRWQWQEGSLAFWDNRATWHYALNDYHGHRRLMHRITVQGSPIPALAA